MRIAVVGAGNAGCAHALKFKEKGHRVSLLKTSNTIHEDNFAHLQKTGCLVGIDNSKGGVRTKVHLDMVSKDAEEAIRGADVIFVTVQTLYHEEVARKISPYIEDGQLIIIAPGYMGSLYFRKSCTAANLVFAEGESLPFDARLIEPGVVNILFRNVRNALAFLPKSAVEESLIRADRLAGCYKFLRENIIDSAMHNPNLIVHTVGAITSAGRIEYSGGDFWMYREAFTPSILNLLFQLDNEKMMIMEAFGLRKIPYFDACKFRNEEDLSVDGLQVFRNYAARGSPKGPASVNTRFIYEDVPMGLCLMSSLGRKVGVPTPTCDAMITLASAFLKRDFQASGRTLGTLGLDGMNTVEINEYITGGVLRSQAKRD